MVEQIGDLRSHLSANGLLDRDALNERHGYRLSAWPTDIARRRVSEAADGVSRGRESRGIDPLADRLPRVGLTPGTVSARPPVELKALKPQPQGSLSVLTVMKGPL